MCSPILLRVTTIFMCEACHQQDADICDGLRFGRSQGRCEVCGKTAACVDCKAYKRLTLPELLRAAGASA